MQWWIAKQAQVLGASVPKGFIANTPGTRERTKRVLEGKATLSKAKMEDLQGDEDDTLSRDDLIRSQAHESQNPRRALFSHTRTPIAPSRV
jgi:hypothetical protein